MNGTRFVFLTLPRDQEDGAGGVVWLLVSPNNRPLGRARQASVTYAECVAAVAELQRNHSRLRPSTATVESTGTWAWRIDLNGSVVAVSSRSYLRQRECTYNLDRFLEAVPGAALVEGTRLVRRAGGTRPGG